MALQAQALGAWNLIAEIGAVLSPVVGGVLRETTETWAAALALNTAVLAAGAVLVFLVRESERAT